MHEMNCARGVSLGPVPIAAALIFDTYVRRSLSSSSDSSRSKDKVGAAPTLSGRSVEIECTKAYICMRGGEAVGLGGGGWRGPGPPRARGGDISPSSLGLQLDLIARIFLIHRGIAIHITRNCLRRTLLVQRLRFG